MTEGETLFQEQRSAITIERPLRDGGVKKIQIEVPFSEEEVSHIQAARQVFGSETLTEERTRGSGPIRDLIDAPIPWGYTLEDRNDAIARMRRAQVAISAIASEPPSYLGPEVLEEITTMKEHLDKALGDIQEKV